MVVSTFIIINTMILIIINDGPTKILLCTNISFTSQILNGNAAFGICFFPLGSFSSKNTIHSYPRVCFYIVQSLSEDILSFTPQQQEDWNPFHTGQIRNLRLGNLIIKHRNHNPARSPDSGSHFRKLRCFVCFFSS